MTVARGGARIRLVAVTEDVVARVVFPPCMGGLVAPSVAQHLSVVAAHGVASDTAVAQNHNAAPRITKSVAQFADAATPDPSSALHGSHEAAAVEPEDRADVADAAQPTEPNPNDLTTLQPAPRSTLHAMRWTGATPMH